MKPRLRMGRCATLRAPCGRSRGQGDTRSRTTQALSPVLTLLDREFGASGGDGVWQAAPVAGTSRYAWTDALSAAAAALGTDSPSTTLCSPEVGQHSYGNRRQDSIFGAAAAADVIELTVA